MTAQPTKAIAASQLKEEAAWLVAALFLFSREKTLSVINCFQSIIETYRILVLVTGTFI